MRFQSYGERYERERFSFFFSKLLSTYILHISIFLKLSNQLAENWYQLLVCINVLLENKERFVFSQSKVDSYLIFCTPFILIKSTTFCRQLTQAICNPSSFGLFVVFLEMFPNYFQIANLITDIAVHGCQIDDLESP